MRANYDMTDAARGAVLTSDGKLCVPIYRDAIEPSAESKRFLLPEHATTVRAKLTSKNRVTLPQSVIAAIGATEYFDVEVKDGRIVLSPVRIQRGNALRAKLAKLDLQKSDIADAVARARTGASKKTTHRK